MLNIKVLIMNNKDQHILIVDDNLKNLQITAKILREKSFAISLAQSGQEALKLVEEVHPSLVLLDIMMPEMDGYEVCRKIKADQKNKELPIVFLTAKDTSADLVEGFNAGGVDYIVKPFNRDELITRVSNHLELAHSRKKIIEMSLNQDKLYSIIAHDIRSPLAGITMMLNLLSDGTVSPQDPFFKETIKSLKETSDRTISILNDLLEWANVKSDSSSLQIRPINLNSLLKDVLALLKTIADKKAIHIDLNISKKTVIIADETSMHTVFRNILSNAIKFTPLKGKIKITSSEENDRTKIHFKDNGIGMSEEIIQKVFNDNQHHTTYGTNNEKGTGLGTKVIKDFVKKNGGTIEVKSSIEKGTIFTVCLPSSKV